MKVLTDEQYEELKQFAGKKGMSLHGYQSINNSVNLRNSLTTGVQGKTINELIEAITKACDLYTPRKYNA